MADIVHGCVALLDALGTRTASIEQATAYLDTLSDIQTVVAEFQMPTGERELRGRVTPKHPGGAFRVRFFSDTILITLPFDRDHLNWVPVARMFAGVSSVIAVGLKRGILFRGAIAIGQYVESEDAVLGPAILDAAQWFETPELFGAIATPNAMFSIQRILLDRPEGEGSDDWPVGARQSLGIPYDVPLKNNKTLSTHAADWTFSARIRSSEAAKNIEKWFFSVVQDLIVSPDVEAKYRHSLDFLRHCQSRWKAACRAHD